MEQDKQTKQMEAALGEPFALDFSEYTRKVRNNLVFTGMLSIILITHNLILDEHSSFFGLKFISLDMCLIYSILFWLTLYFLIHFLWLAWDNFIMWRLRLTGTHTLYEGGLGFGAEDKKDPSQTTLYYWWMKQSKKLDKHPIPDIKPLYNKLLKHTEFTKVDGTINSNIDTLNTNLKQYNDIFASKRLEVSINRFDNTWKHFQSSQNYRWLFLEFLTPIGIGVYSLLILALKIFNS